MKHPKALFSILILVLVLTFAAASLYGQPAERPSDMVGLALVGHTVADLERSIKFFEAIDFKLIDGPTKWTVDKEVNKLGNTSGAESRTATMRVQSSVSDVPFTLVLRQYRGAQQQDFSKANSWDLLASHIDLTVDGNVSALLDKLEALNMLKMPEVNGLPNPRQQPGFRRFAFIQDPDGLVLEYFSKPIPKPGDPPPAPTVSNSSATAQNIDRLGKQAGFNHYAFNIINPEKAQDFYVKVLGGDYPPIENPDGAQKWPRSTAALGRENAGCVHKLGQGERGLKSGDWRLGHRNPPGSSHARDDARSKACFRAFDVRDSTDIARRAEQPDPQLPVKQGSASAIPLLFTGS